MRLAPRCVGHIQDIFLSNRSAAVELGENMRIGTTSKNLGTVLSKKVKLCSECIGRSFSQYEHIVCKAFIFTTPL